MKKSGVILGAAFWAILFAMPANAVPRLVDIQSKFYGTSMRLIFIFDQPADIRVFQDWEEQLILVSAPGLELDAGTMHAFRGAGNFVVASVAPARTGTGGNSIAIRTSRDFVTKQVPLADKRYYTLDVFALVHRLPAGTYVQRGMEYESRREYHKALASYRKALDARSGFDEAYFRAGLVRMHIGDTKRALVNFKNVSGNSRFASLAAQYTHLLAGEKSARGDVLAVNGAQQDANGEAGGNGEAVSVAASGDSPGETAKEDGAPPEETAGAMKGQSPGEGETQGAGGSESGENDDGTPVVAGANAAEESEVRHGSVIDASDGGKEIPVKYAGWYQVELKETPDGGDEQTAREKGILGDLIARTGELNTFLSYWWHAILASGIFIIVLLGYAIYRIWPGRKRKGNKKVSRYLDRELKKELKRRRTKHGTEETEKLPEFANKLVDLYRKTDGTRQEHINRELEKSEIVKDPFLFDEEYEKRGRAVNKILGESESEIVHLTKQFIKKDERKGTNPDKYQAVMQLKKKEWTEERIAQELHMGVEEVRLVIDMWRMKHPEIPAQPDAASAEPKIRKPERRKGGSRTPHEPLDVDALRKRISSVRV